MSSEWLEDPVILKVKRWCSQRGNNGVRSLVQWFRKNNTALDDKLSFAEFAAQTKACGLNLTDIEVRHLAIAFDTENDGLISLSEFLGSLAAGLPQRRKFTLERIWASFQHDSDGNVALDEVRGQFNPADHPLVRAQELSYEEAAENFFSHFTNESNPTGVVTREEFFAFYAGVSQTIPDDDYFESRMYAVWRIQPPTSSGPNSYGSVKSAYDEGRRDPTYLNSTKRLPGESATLQKSYALYGPNSRNYDTSHLQSKKGKALTHSLTSPIPALNPPTYETTQRTSYQPPSAADLRLARPALVYGRKDRETISTHNTEMEQIISQFRDLILKKAGKAGFRGLTRILRIIDENGNKMLDKYELQNGLQTYGLTLTSQQMDQMLSVLDLDGSGQVSVAEFLHTIRGSMNDYRLGLVQQAYMLLDTQGDESVTLGEIKQLMDVKRHPDVVRREKTAGQALQEFNNGWDKPDHCPVTWEEFYDYYSDISAGIPSDDEFELLIRSIWHVSGGTGKFANVSGRRVTHLDGTQSVHEILNDLRIGPEDTDLMLENLQMQKVKDIKKVAPLL